MSEDEESERATLRVFAIAALALLGLAFSATPIAQRLDANLLDAQWSLLRKFDPRPAPDDIIVVGLDETTLRALKDPAGIWYEPLARALARIAAAKPRAIALDLPLPERSFESVRPGLDRMLLAALLAARENGPLVAVIDIDARTRAARQIHPPYLAVLNDERLSLGMLSRDVDGVTRRFSLTVPTEDGGFPTLAGRLCRALTKSCSDGLIHYALGAAYRYVPLQQVIDSNDPLFVQRLFRDRIVMIGETQRFSDRVEVPVNLAGWEPGGRSSPGVVVHAQALRTALLGAAPVEVARPVGLLLVTAAALLVLMRRSRLALAIALLAAAGILVAATLLLRGGLFLPIAASILTLALAWSARALYESRARYGRRAQLRATFESRVSPSLQPAILRGKVQVDEKPEGRPLACLAASFAGARDPPPPTQLPLAELEKLHEIFAAAVHRQGGMVESFAAGSALAVFGAPAALDDPCRHAAAAAREILQAVGRLDDERGNRGKAPVRWAMAASFGTGVAGKVAARGPLAHAVSGAVIEEALLLRLEAERLGKRFVASSAFEACAGCGLSDFQHLACD